MGEGRRPKFWDWFACPECGERHHVSSLAYGTDIVLECYECGLTAQYEIGTDVPLDGLDLGAIKEAIADD